MKKIYSLGLIFGIALASQAQSIELLWGESTGGTDFDMLRDICVDHDGNIISVGQFAGTVDFDPGSGTSNLSSVSGSADIFIRKVDSNGNLLWVKSIGNYASDIANSVAVDASDNIFITGSFRDEVDFDPGSGTTLLGQSGNTIPQIFILKMDSDGNFSWAKEIGSSGGADQGLKIAIDGSDFILVSGVFNQTVDFDPGAGVSNLTANATTNYDIFLLKLYPTGDFWWVGSVYGTSGNNFPEDLQVAGDNSIILTGSVGGTGDIDPTSGNQSFTTAGYDDIFILKMSSMGVFQWGHVLGGIYGDVGKGIAIDNDGNIFLTGAYHETVDFDPGPGTAILIGDTPEYAFVLKLKPNGTYVRVVSFDGGSSRGFSIDLDADANVYVTGSYSISVDFDPQTGTAFMTSIDLGDVFVQCMDSSAQFLWAKSMGGTGENQANSLDLDASGSIYVGGYFENTMDLDPGAGTLIKNTAGSGDMFLVKLGTCNLDNSVNQSGITLTANQTGATYQWMNCGTFAPVSGANSASFTPSADGDYAVIITMGGCKDTSTCYTVQGVGIESNQATKPVIYPNPARSGIHIVNATPLIQVTIHNLAGEQVLVSTEKDIPVESLPAGVYLIQVITPEGFFTSRFIKE